MTELVGWSTYDSCSYSDGKCVPLHSLFNTSWQNQSLSSSIRFITDTNSSKTNRSTGPKIFSTSFTKFSVKLIGIGLGNLLKKSLWMRLNARRRKSHFVLWIRIALVGCRSAILHTSLTSSDRFVYTLRQDQWRYPSIFLFLQPHPPVQAVSARVQWDGARVSWRLRVCTLWYSLNEFVFG